MPWSVKANNNARAWKASLRASIWWLSELRYAANGKFIGRNAASVSRQLLLVTRIGIGHDRNFHCTRMLCMKMEYFEPKAVSLIYSFRMALDVRRYLEARTTSAVDSMRSELGSKILLGVDRWIGAPLLRALAWELLACFSTLKPA